MILLTVSSPVAVTIFHPVMRQQLLSFQELVYEEHRKGIAN
jgi:hypothetical protein